MGYVCSQYLYLLCRYRFKVIFIIANIWMLFLIFNTRFQHPPKTQTSQVYSKKKPCESFSNTALCGRSNTSSENKLHKSCANKTLIVNKNGTSGRERKKDFPKMTLTVRTGATPRLIKQFYCMFLRTTVLFWPSAYGNIVLILDANSENDRFFGKTILKQMIDHFPQYGLQVLYEPLPKNPLILEGKSKTPQYTRQIWSQFFSHLYTNETVIAYMDTDVLFLTTISKENLINKNKLKVFGHGGFSSWVFDWDSTTRKALGLPMILNFMVTFPQLIYRETYVNCRQHILNHLKMTDFDEAFTRFHPEGTIMSPVNVLLTYAWFYEKDCYDWHLKIPDLTFVNSRLPEGHKVQPEDTDPDIVPVAHISDTKTWVQGMVTPGYCLSMTAQGQVLPGCQGVNHNFSRICDFYEKDFISNWEMKGSWCKGWNMTYKKCCERTVMEHYKHVEHMARTRVHTVQRKKAEVVSGFAKEMGVTCEPLDMP